MIYYCALLYIVQDFLRLVSTSVYLLEQIKHAYVKYRTWRKHEPYLKWILDPNDWLLRIIK